MEGDHSPGKERSCMSFSPFTIPTRSEHERDLAGGKSQVPYEDLVALLEEIALAEEELIVCSRGRLSLCPATGRRACRASRSWADQAGNTAPPLPGYGSARSRLVPDKRAQRASTGALPRRTVERAAEAVAAGHRSDLPVDESARTIPRASRCRERSQFGITRTPPPRGAAHGRS